MTPPRDSSTFCQFDPMDWMSSLPPEVQAAIIGCLGLLVAAGFTAWVAFHQYRLQRALEIKKEFLLDSVRAAHQANACLGLMMDSNRTTEEISKLFTEHLGKLAVASSVADIETVGKGKDLLNTLGPAFIKLVVARMSFVGFAENIKRVEDLIDSQYNDNARYFAMQSEALAAGDDSRFQNIQHMLKAGTNQFNSLLQEKDELIPQVERERRILFEKMVEIQANVMQSIREYVASVRKDMSVGKRGDQEAFMSASYIDPLLVKEAVKQAFSEMGASAHGDKG